MEVTINEIKANLESLPESFYSEVRFYRFSERQTPKSKFK